MCVSYASCLALGSLASVSPSPLGEVCGVFHGSSTTRCKELAYDDVLGGAVAICVIEPLISGWVGAGISARRPLSLSLVVAVVVWSWIVDREGAFRLGWRPRTAGPPSRSLFRRPHGCGCRGNAGSTRGDSGEREVVQSQDAPTALWPSWRAPGRTVELPECSHATGAQRRSRRAWGRRALTP